MFYNRFIECCNERGISPSTLLKKLNMSKGNLEKWRSGAIPRGTSLQKLADYFNVSTDYLLGNEHKRSPVDDDEAEVWRIRDEMRKKPGLRVLFDLSKNATPEDLELINQIIRKMVGRNNE